MTTRSLSELRCFNHAVREAVARCPQCTRFYCRECITEHEDRVVCALCLKELTRARIHSRQHLRGVLQFLQVLTGVIIAWIFFYVAGRGLLMIPTAFHEGTVWEDSEPENR